MKQTVFAKGFMEYEIELKLLTDENAGEIIETKLLPQLNAIVSQDILELTNHYFDSKDRTLRKNDIGLRIRGNNGKFEQTLKTSGKSVGGLHQRPEYNVQLDASKKQSVKFPDLSLFPMSAWPEIIDIIELQTKIGILFTTHFSRKLYLLEFSNGDMVELVWDLGEITSGNKSVPICEIELELKRGGTSVLFDLARQLVNVMPATIGTDSKAARGYSLIDGDSVNKVAQYHPNFAKSKPVEAEEFASILTLQLRYFQTLSTTFRLQFCDTIANNISEVLVSLVGNLAEFSHHYSCQVLDSLHVKLNSLASEWSLVRIQKNKTAASNLLTQAQTTQLQLDIVQCLVEQPWENDN